MDTILDRFERCVRKFPDKIALWDQERQITFLQLQSEAQQIAVGLAACQSTGEPVGVWAGHRAETIVLFLAVLYSGNYYVPLDEDAPAERIQTIVANSGMRLIIGKTERSVNGVPCRTKAQLLCGTQDREALEAVRGKILSTNPLYAVYTSGSTGVPKGVVKSHLAVMSFIDSFTRRFPFESEDILGNQTPFYFDASAKDIYLCLLLGITVNIIDKRLFSIPLELVGFLNDRRVSTICWSPSALMILSQLNTFRSAVPRFLKRVFFVGETFWPKQLMRWKEALPDVAFINLYGSSEIAGVCTAYEIPGDYQGEEIPLGKALPDTEVFLMKEEKGAFSRIETPGETGEICVRGSVVGLGYLKDPARTAEVFIQNPFSQGYRDILYRTGDLGKLNEKGELLYLSRKDFQIKHMGYRIELPEIEIQCNRLEGVKKSACVYHAERRWILLYVEPEPGRDLLAAEIADGLKAVLPAYMMPRKIKILKEIPLNANGKTDRMRLLEGDF